MLIRIHLLLLAYYLIALASTFNVGHVAADKPPMGFNSYNHFGLGVSAELLLDTADAFVKLGLQDAGYVYINSDDGWLDLNRTESGKLRPCKDKFPNGISSLVAKLHDMKFLFGIYAAAGQTTCGNRAGSLYHEVEDATQFVEWGVDYLKYDDCGEANLQSYTRYFVMKDALLQASSSTNGSHSRPPVYYSFEPYCVYCRNATQMMSWVSHVGDSWRTAGDIRPTYKSIMNNAYATNKWIGVSRPKHHNDADMLEVGNGKLTISEQRSHFALWCLLKSPLLIGADVRKLSNESLQILKNSHLIAINQDTLGIQGTLCASRDYQNTSKTKDNINSMPPNKGLKQKGITKNQKHQDNHQQSHSEEFNWVTYCTFHLEELPPLEQQWRIEGKSIVQISGKVCLGRSLSDTSVGVYPCDGSDTQTWSVGKVNQTLSQIRDDSSSLCLAFNGSLLFMEPCRSEPVQCSTTRCKFSVLVHQLWYLNSLGQLSASYTNFPGGAPPPLDDIRDGTLASVRGSAYDNFPYCIATTAVSPPKPPRTPPIVDTKLPLQVWSGPLYGGDVAVLLLNTGDISSQIIATWEDIGLEKNMRVHVIDMWTGANVGTVNGQIEAQVESHDVAAYRLQPIWNSLIAKES